MYVTFLQLEDLANYNTDEFWTKVVDDVSALIGNIEGLSSLSQLASSLGTIDINNLMENEELLNTIQTLLTDNGPDTILAKYVFVKLCLCYISLTKSLPHNKLIVTYVLVTK